MRPHAPLLDPTIDSSATEAIGTWCLKATAPIKVVKKYSESQLVSLVFHVHDTMNWLW